MKFSRQWKLRISFGDDAFVVTGSEYDIYVGVIESLSAWRPSQILVSDESGRKVYINKKFVKFATLQEVE